MKKIIAMLLLLSFTVSMPVRAAVIREFDPIEKELMRSRKDAENQQLTNELQESQTKKDKVSGSSPSGASSGSRWWKWALGLLVVGGAAAAAGGGGNKGGGSTTSGTVTLGW